MAALITAPRLMAVGGGALADLPGLMGRLGLARPLIVTDPYIAGCGILDRATALLDDAHIPWAVFKDTVPDPTTDALDAGVARMRARMDNDDLRQPRRDRRRQLDRHGEGHVGALRQWRQDARLQGAERDPARRPAGRRDPDHRRHRLRGHALHGHHRHRDRREDADRRPRVLSGGGDRRLRADPDDAAAADRRYRHRQPDARDRGLCQPPRQPVRRRAREKRDGADRAQHPHRLRRARTTAPRARR